jgi:SAM-dependent methyltransferase
MIGGVIRKVTGPVRRIRGRRLMGDGQFNRTRPLSKKYGYDRGTPIDRFFIEQFLEAHAADIRGRVLEVGDDTYSRKFGRHRITAQDVLHVDGTNRKATFCGDICNPATLPSSAFDCIVLTQTLHLIFDMAAAVRQIRRALRPGGVVLVTAPGITPIHAGPWASTWYWSLTGVAMRQLLNDSFAGEEVTVRAYGNLFAATAFLHGAAVEEVQVSQLERFDAAYPVVIGGRAVNGGQVIG